MDKYINVNQDFEKLKSEYLENKRLVINNVLLKEYASL